MDWALFFKEYGVNILTVLAALVLSQAGTIKAWLQARLASAQQKQKAKLDIEKRAWERVLSDGQKANGFVDRLLLQQENHLAAMMERDRHVERFVSEAVNTMRETAQVMERTVDRQENLDKKRDEQMARLASILDVVAERMAGVGLVMGMYLHDRQGVTFDGLIASIRKPIPKQQEAKT